MNVFEHFLLLERGQAAGRYEVHRTDVDEMLAYADELLQRGQSVSVDEAIPDFRRNYERVKRIVARHGKTKRRDMPVINDDDVNDFQRKLQQGAFDINKPFHEKTDRRDPFPDGLSGEEAEKWLDRGLRDGNLHDDKVAVRQTKQPVGKLIPIQRQIYGSKVLEPMSKFGVTASIEFYRSTINVISSDLRIIDGHHRWFGANLIDPRLEMNGLLIDLPIADLLDLARSYGDAIGNKRNR